MRTCEHGMTGCLMPERHEATECHNEEMIEDQDAEYLAERAAPLAQFLMSDPELAMEVLRQLDEQLHPWGWVGEVPAEDGEYFVVKGDGHPVAALIKTTPTGRWVTYERRGGEAIPARNEWVEQLQFRKRLTPVAPGYERVLDAEWVVAQDE